MRISILIMGDLHIQAQDDKILSLKDQVFDSIKNLYKETDCLFLIFPGDIAYSGKPEQYSLFFTFIEDIKKQLYDYKKNKMYDIFVPGNHDCNFEGDYSVRDEIIKNIKSSTLNKFTDAVVATCTAPQEEYFNFTDMYIKEEYILYKDNLLIVYRFPLDNTSFVLYGYNLSWMSQKYEEYGAITFPLERYNDAILKYNADLTISILHQPIWWLNNYVQREFLDFIASRSNIVITGHEHRPDDLTLSSKTIDNLKIFESGAMQTHPGNFSSQFRFLEFELPENRFKNISFSYDSKNNIYSSDKDIHAWDQFGKLKSSSAPMISREFQNILGDPGANYAHPDKNQLTLSDFYIFPDLFDISDKYFFINATPGQEKTINSIQLVNLHNNRVILSGPENIGKTSLLYNLFSRLFEQGYYPIYIEGERIRSSSISEIKKILNKCFNEQYTCNNISFLDQLDTKKLVLLIDDIDHCSFNKRFMTSLFSALTNNYDNLILSSGNIFSIEDIIYRDSSNKDILGGFKFYGLKHFGHLLRKKLVRKWLSIGNDIYLTDSAHSHIVVDYLKILNTIVGNNLVPSYPFYLLTVLQTIGTGIHNNLEHSSYGHYYDYLITTCLNSIKLSNNEITAYENFLSELGFKLFRRREYFLDSEELKGFMGWYKDEYDITFNMDSVVSNLAKTGILKQRDGKLFFSYKYLYYYFLAKYLSDNIAEQPIKDIISDLAAKMYHSFNGNVLMFLTHLSKHPLIIDYIIRESKTCFASCAEIKMDSDITVINDLIDEIPEIVLKNISADEAHDQKLKAIDELGVNKSATCDGIIEYPEEAQPPDGAMNMLMEINKSVKCIELLGQLGKSYYGSLKGPRKMEITGEAYSICLRTLCSFFDLLKNNINVIVEDITEYMKQNRKKYDLLGKEDVEKISRRFVFGLSSLVTYLFIRGTSQRIGTKELEKTYEKILADDYVISKRLIDMAMKFDYLYDIPENTLFKLHDETRNNNLANYVLRQIVLDYLYMYETDFDTKQRICDKLGLLQGTRKSIMFKGEHEKRQQT